MSATSPPTRSCAATASRWSPSRATSSDAAGVARAACRARSREKESEFMAFNLRNRSFVKEIDFTPKEWKFLLDIAAELKVAKYAGSERPRLVGKNLALIFEKTSTRTRCAFEVAAFDQGARVTYLDPTGSQIGHKESMADTARVLGRMYDGIEYRGSAQAKVETLAEYAGVPVWNGLTDDWHPTQTLCDMLKLG